MPPAPRFERWPTLPALFFDQAATLGDRPLLRVKRDKEWRRLSWRDVSAEVERVAAGLSALGVGQGDRVCLVSENRPEWLVADLAVMTLGAVTVPAYTTIGVPDYEHVLRDSGSQVVVVSGGQLARRVHTAASHVSCCKHIVTIDAVELPDAQGLTSHRWTALPAPGAALDVAALVARGQSDDPACIIYTSGTGGTPRGVVLSHRNVLANCAGAQEVLDEIGLGEELFLSCLPLSHAYEHSCGQFFPLSLGAEIAYVEALDKLSANLQELKPTIIMVVPRLCEVVQQRIQREVEKGDPKKRRLFELALELGRKRYRRGGTLPFWQVPVDLMMDRLVRSRIQEKLGGRIKGLISGGAALSPETGLFFHALGVPLLQGYGQTEAAPLISVNRFSNPRHDTVGPPVRGCEVRIAEDGEILARGPNVMLGYWGDDAATERTVRDGWLHTGDVGHIDQAGRIVITDRKKDILVTSGGDNVSPARVEGRLMLEPEIGQAVVVGDKRPYIGALIVPEADVARTWARDRGKTEDMARLCEDPEFRKLISAAVDRANTTLAGVERIRKFALVPESFSIENGLMTPTLKIRRPLVQAHYKDRIEGLWE
ncbi:MAG TPA: long-chain fatty acid--CoA ligase [Azospirillaceae bacterium]|nr:long-chain fatty acid--CoA ligase [Azospirillaceae bacterium]